MATNISKAEKILETVKQANQEAIVMQPIELADQHQNELVMFIKPEVFMDTTEDKMVNAVEMMLDKLDDYDATVNGLVAIPGPVLESQKIMNRHYGYINQMSRQASQMVTEDDLRTIAESLAIDPEGYQILGGHEFLQAYPNTDGKQLDALWFEEGSTKIRSGFYVRAVEHQADQIVLVNAFHPEQLAHFTLPDRTIVLMVVQSDTPWAVLRTQMIGDSFPEKAQPDSIRGILYHHPIPFGFEQVSIANNTVHLSAGPTEALFELNNFLSGTVGLDMASQPPNLLRRLMLGGLSYEQAVMVLENPTISINGVEKDLHSHFEHVDTDQAVSQIVNHFK